MHPVLVALHNAIPLYAIDTYGFVKHKQFNYNSSKTYQILNSFNLTDNWFSVKKKTDIPTPQEVFSRVINFDKQACLKNAENKQHEYHHMMEDILSRHKK